MEKELGRINKKDDTDIVVRLDDFGGRVGLTIREFVTSDQYTGFTKSGTRIPVDKVAELKDMLNSISQEELNKIQEEVAENNQDEQGQQEQSQQQGQNNNEQKVSTESIDEDQHTL